MWSTLIGWVEAGRVPDPVIRAGIRRLLAQRARESGADDVDLAAALESSFVTAMRTAPVALLTEKANEQHYEVPAAFFTRVLGPRRKYSSCFWGEAGSVGQPDGRIDSLEAAEINALTITAERAGIGAGQRVLELGCGWGSFCLWAAERYPRTSFVGVSNSHGQRLYIEGQARERGLTNLRVITEDINRFEPEAHGLVEGFDRIVSVEMLEHTRNWQVLFGRIARWIVPGGRFFMHVFCHRDAPYAFEDRDASDWMSRHFFSGGMMPSDHLPLHFQDDLRLIERWRWNGQHYERTLNAWLERMDAQRAALLPLFGDVYGADADRWWQRWRLFFMACAELFGYRGGEQWWVGHYLFEPRAGRLEGASADPARQ